MGFCAGPLVPGCGGGAWLGSSKASAALTAPEEAGIRVEGEFGEKIWRRAGTALEEHATGRRKQSGATPRRLLADFLIGAHAPENVYKLLTLDGGMHRRAFPGLRLEMV